MGRFFFSFFRSLLREKRKKKNKKLLRAWVNYVCGLEGILS
jgi:ABC-type transporter lipoprotein component MlaA